jgi:hypothetical protein
LNLGCPNKAFDFHDQFLAISFSGNWSFGGKIGVQYRSPILYEVRIIGDQPAIFDEGTFDRIVDNV